MSTTPRVTRETALASAVRYVSPLGAYTVRDVSLGILPRGDRSVTDRLVWQIGIDVNNPFEDPAEWRVFVDAQSGAVAFAYNDLHTADVGGIAKTMFSGDNAVRLDKTASSTYALRDLTRGGGNYTCTMNNSTISCALATTSTTTFGTGTVTTSGITAAGDAHFGMQATWDYFKNTFGRNGINNAGKRAYSRVHYGNRYENAFWSDSCFCMTYGDGATTFQPLVSVDVAGHEMAHGVMATSANLTYSGESGGLNESSSDIFGTLVEYAVNSAADVPDYWIGERIFKANWVNGVYSQTRALRYMNDPAKDGASRACWSSGLGTIDVHYSSGPNNHMFWLLAEGGTSKCNGAVVTGIGRAKAAQIWYKAINTYMTKSTNYAGARAAALSAASALYGSSSPEKAAVAAAYSAINVN